MTLLKTMPSMRYWSRAALVHRRHELGRPAAAFLSIFCSQAGSDICAVGLPKVCWNESRCLSFQKVDCFSCLMSSSRSIALVFFHLIAYCISFLVLYCMFCCTVHYCLFSFLIVSFLATSSIKLNLNLNVDLIVERQRIRHGSNALQTVAFEYAIQLYSSIDKRQVNSPPTWTHPWTLAEGWMCEQQTLRCNMSLSVAAGA